MRLHGPFGPWLAALAVLLALGALAAPPTHKKRSTVIHRAGPPEPVSNRRRWFAVEPYESRCVHQGGICRYVHDCPKGQLTSMKGLCPDQRKHGVECCYARPTFPKPSRKSRNSGYSRHHRRNNKHNKYWQKKQ